MALETELAEVQWTQVESRDAVKTYNKIRSTKVVADMPGFDWTAWAKPQGIDKSQRMGHRPAVVLQGLRRDGAEDAARAPGRRGWPRRSSRMNAPYLSEPFVEARFEFFGKTLSGQQQQRPRWKRGVQLVNGSMGEALGQLYVAKHFPAASKARMEKMIANLLEAYRQSITEPRLDDAGDAQGSARQAREVLAEDRLSAQVARLQRAAGEGRRPRRQRRARESARDTNTRSASSASRSIATSG